LSGVVADLLANFRANVDPLKNDLTKASGMINNFGKTLSKAAGGVGGLAMGLLGTEAGIRLLERGFNATVGTVKKVIASTAEYSDQIRQLTRDTGMSVEQSAKMLMIADDSQVSFSNLTTAMKFAIKDGVLPNIEGIAKLSDQYIALNNPLLRSQMLIEQFGRNGLEMSKIMELGSTTIKKLGDTADEVGLVMSNLDIKKMRDYEMALNEMKDASQGLGVQLALTLSPALTDIANSFSDTVKGGRESTLQLESARKAYAEMGLNVAEADRVMAKHVFGIYDEIQTSEAWINALGKENYLIDEQGRVINKTTAIYQQYARARLDAYKSGTGQLPTEAPIIPEAGTLKGAYESAVGNVVQSKELFVGSDQVQPILDAIELIKPYSRSAADEYSQQLAIMTAAAQVQSKEISLSEAAANLKRDFGMATSVATSAINSTGGAAKALNGLRSDIWIFVHTIQVGGYNVSIPGGSNPSTNVPGHTYYGGGQAANGVNFTVPAGYPNDSFPMFVESGEKVIVIPRNKVNQIPKFGDGTEGLPMDVDYGNYFSQGKVWQYSRQPSGALSNKGTEFSPGDITNPGHSDLMTSIANMLKESQTSSSASIQTSVTKSVKESINVTIAGLVTAQTDKTSQQISTISGRQQETAQKNTMISGDMLAELTAIRKGIENIPIAVRDAVTLVAD
jgi:hypothetical protein